MVKTFKYLICVFQGHLNPHKDYYYGCRRCNHLIRGGRDITHSEMSGYEWRHKDD